jgi:hypothetical protein
MCSCCVAHACICTQRILHPSINIHTSYIHKHDTHTGLQVGWNGAKHAVFGSWPSWRYAKCTKHHLFMCVSYLCLERMPYVGTQLWPRRLRFMSYTFQSGYVVRIYVFVLVCTCSWINMYLFACMCAFRRVCVPEPSLLESRSKDEWCISTVFFMYLCVCMRLMVYVCLNFDPWLLNSRHSWSVHTYVVHTYVFLFWLCAYLWMSLSTLEPRCVINTQRQILKRICT